MVEGSFLQDLHKDLFKILQRSSLNPQGSWQRSLQDLHKDLSKILKRSSLNPQGSWQRSLQDLYKDLFKVLQRFSLCMALVVSAFKLSHGCVGCSCFTPVRFFAILYSCGIEFISQIKIGKKNCM